MFTNEKWEKIKGFTRYEVSSCGRVRNLHTKQEKAIRRTKTGYCITDLKENGKKKTAYIHRLVAEAFIDNPSNLPQINHIDENKGNNHVENLEWCSPEYNNAYGTHNEKIRKTQTKTKGKRVAQLNCTNNQALNVFDSISEAAKVVGITKQAINWALAKDTHTAGGFRWVVV